MNRKISIILSTYNEAKIIESTIREIFNKIDNVEIVLVDDNSTDGTLDKLKNINNPNLKIYSREQRGLASAFLLGMINTSGDLVGWTDSNMPQITKHFDKMIGRIRFSIIIKICCWWRRSEIKFKNFI